jgi:hypothetical protein
MSLLLADRRLHLLGLNAILAIVLGFFTFTSDQSLRLVIYGGYWAMLGLTAWFVYSLWRLARDDGWGRGTGVTWRSWPRWPLLLVSLCGIILLVHESYGFKILMDEAMLLGTSMTMHFEKTALVPMRGNDIQGAFQLLSGELDKRPLLQPFLTSVLHDTTGYRPENAFVLNTVLTFTLLGLAFHIGRRIGGAFGGAAIVLLLTGLPLLAQNATGGGFEILNLVMILATVALGSRWIEKRDPHSLTAFILAAVLLAHTRYESVLFLLPVALLIFFTWVEERRILISLPLAFAPLLMLPYALHNTVFRSRESAWELASQPGYEKPFSISYLSENFGHALRFFFNTDGTQSNSLMIAALGFIAVPFFGMWWMKALPKLRSLPPMKRVSAAFAVGFAAHTALLMCYFWGKFDDPVIRRLSLPLNLGLVLAIIAVVSEFGRPWLWRALTIAAVAGLFAHSLPAMARHDYTLSYYVGREGDWKRDFIAAHPEKDYLVIDDNSIFWITHLVSSTPMLQARERKEAMAFNLRNRTFSAIYVFQGYDVDAKTGKMSVVPADDLGPDYELETVWERRFTLVRVSRISRVKAVREGTATPPRPAPPPMQSLTTAEQEKIRSKYFERFLQKLP